jgi:NAD(P)-dependent dehydrogenase (short-subunit alcohol dehydrogenase family)
VSSSEQRVVIITGGSRGIGAGLVEAYRHQGWGVVANSRSIDPSADEGVLAVQGDVAVPGTAERIVEETLNRFGRIDSLVNNAGIFISKPFVDYTAEDFASLVSVNLTGFFRLTQRVIGEMLERGGGHVVNVTTTLVDYADSLAVEYASRGVRVNAVSLGVIQTPSYPPSSYDVAAKRQLLGRVGQIGDVARGILFLEASPYITGETLHIDGGQIAGH